MLPLLRHQPVLRPREWQAQRPSAELKTVLADVLPKRFAQRLCEVWLPNRPMKQYNEPQLRELVRRLHGSTFHVGERYTAGGVEEGSERARLGTLREQLRMAIETENFELAAELRDRLRVLE